MRERLYAIASCPVPVVDDESLSGWEPCGADMDAQLQVHEDGAEYGVWVVDMLRSPRCGHDMRAIARAEQDSLLGIEP